MNKTEAIEMYQRNKEACERYDQELDKLDIKLLKMTMGAFFIIIVAVLLAAWLTGVI